MPNRGFVRGFKVPRPATLASSAARERFFREGKAAARLRHPNIVPVFDSGSDPVQPYIASALIEGQPLSKAIPPTGMEFRRAARLVQELAEAVAYAHIEGVIHRDLKPANVILDREDRPNLTDFGLAALSDADLKLTRTMAVLGTPAYMAPEQAAGQIGDAKPASDQYALGVMLYQLMTGKMPFSGTRDSVLHKIQTGVVPPPSSFRSGVPAELEAICLKAMAMSPVDRYADCRELAADLRRWLDGESVSVLPLSRTARGVRWARRQPLPATLTAAMLLVLPLSATLATGAAIEAGRRAADAEAALRLENAAKDKATADAEAAKIAWENAERETKEAMASRKDATVQRAVAADNSQVVVQARKLYSDAEHVAKNAKTQAKLGAAELVKAKRANEEAAESYSQIVKVTDNAVYRKTISEAATEFNKGRYLEVLRLLEACPPPIRGWEWRFLYRLSKDREPTTVIGLLRDSTVTAPENLLEYLEKRGTAVPDCYQINSNGTHLLTYEEKSFHVWDLVSRSKERSLKMVLDENPLQFGYSLQSGSGGGGGALGGGLGFGGGQGGGGALGGGLGGGGALGGGLGGGLGGALGGGGGGGGGGALNPFAGGGDVGPMESLSAQTSRSVFAPGLGDLSYVKTDDAGKKYKRNVARKLPYMAFGPKQNLVVLATPEGTSGTGPGRFRLVVWNFKSGKVTSTSNVQEGQMHLSSDWTKAYRVLSNVVDAYDIESIGEVRQTFPIEGGDARGALKRAGCFAEDSPKEDVRSGFRLWSEGVRLPNGSVSYWGSSKSGRFQAFVCRSGPVDNILVRDASGTSETLCLGTAGSGRNPCSLFLSSDGESLMAIHGTSVKAFRLPGGELSMSCDLEKMMNEPGPYRILPTPGFETLMIACRDKILLWDVSTFDKNKAARPTK